jgi:predicted DNA-binding ribbon-helix-helix protein
MDDEVFEHLTRLAEDADISLSRLLEQLVGQDHDVYERLTQLASSVEVGPGEFLERVVLLERDPYDRLTNMAKQARASGAQFLEHLLLRAEAVWNFQPPLLPPPRPWWKLWSKEERAPELPAIVGDPRNAA